MLTRIQLKAVVLGAGPQSPRKGLRPAAARTSVGHTETASGNAKRYRRFPPVAAAGRCSIGDRCVCVGGGGGVMRS